MQELIEPPSQGVAPHERRNGLRRAPSVVRGTPRSRVPIPGPDRLLARQGENRFVTLLFSDMCRSLEMTRDLHPEDAAAFINRLLVVMVDAVFTNEGCIDGFQGDGALAVFGMPHVRAENPEQAIRAAMQIRMGARCLGLEVTAGINTGAVYVGPVGSERHHETMIMGPAVGLAARLQGLAQPGQILVSEATQRLTRHAFEFTPLTLEIKGLAQPIVGYVVERALRLPEKARSSERCAVG